LQLKKLIHYIIPSKVIVKVIKNVCFFQKHIVGENHIKLWSHILSYKLKCNIIQIKYDEI